MYVLEDSAVLIFIIFFILVIVLWVGSLMYANPSLSTTTNNVKQQCLPGQCIVNIYSGVKTCPKNRSERASIILGQEVCSAPFTCDNPTLPFAVDERGVALGGSECPSGVTCSCVSGPFCGPDIVSYWVPYNASSDSMVKYGQSQQVKDVLGRTHDVPPYALGRGKGTCVITSDMYRQGMLVPNTCLAGTLAYFPEASTTIDGRYTPLACVRSSNTCPIGSTPVWNPADHTLRCEINVPYSIFTT